MTDQLPQTEEELIVWLLTHGVVRQTWLIDTVDRSRRNRLSPFQNAMQAVKQTHHMIQHWLEYFPEQTRIEKGSDGKVRVYCSNMHMVAADVNNYEKVLGHDHQSAEFVEFFEYLKQIHLLRGT